jgi:hypothetical protein
MSEPKQHNVAYFVDALRIVAIITTVALPTGLLGAIYLGWHNRGGQSVVFATATLVGAIVFFGLQLFFELRSKTSVDLITVELTVDRANKSIGRWGSPEDAPIRRLIEGDAVRQLAEKDLNVLLNDTSKTCNDLVVFSFLRYLAIEQSDWQMEERAYVGKSASIVRRKRVSSERDSTSLTEHEIKTKLIEAGNLFAQFFSLQQRYPDLKLPLLSKLSMTADTVTITNPESEIIIEIEPPGLIDHSDPVTRMASEAIEGKPRYETRLIGLRITSRFSGLRIHAPDHHKHEAWVRRIATGAKSWFES